MAKGVSFRVKGIPQIMRQLQAIETDALDELAQGMYIEAQLIMTQAKVYTPVDTGSLRSTGFVAMPEWRKARSTVAVKMGFGGPAAKYAVWVHESVEVYHNPPTMAKFLEVPFLSAVSGMNTRLSSYIRKNI